MTAAVVLPWDHPPLTQNERERFHRMKVARLKRDMLKDARKAIQRADIPAMPYCAVILHWRQKDRRSRDGDGAAPVLKSCLDALVKEGVLVDDDWRHVGHSGVTTHPPQRGQPGSMWLTLDPI